MMSTEIRLLLLSLPLAAAPASGQTLATAEVRTACFVPAPTESFRASPIEPRLWVPDDRRVVNIETEDVLALVGSSGNWVQESAIAGHRGGGYLRWDGPDLFGQPGMGILPFRFRIDQADRYLIRLRNRHEHADPTAENDCWFRLNGGPWHKLVDSWGPSGVGVWSYNAFLEDTGAFPEYDLSVGTHLVELSGRSRNFLIDTVHVLPRSVWFANDTDPPAEPARDRPVIGTDFDFEVDDPTNAAGFVPGQTLAYAFLGRPGPTAPCGMIVGNAGELLLLPDPGEDLFGPTTWTGPSNPALLQATVPLRPDLLGQVYTMQGALVGSGRILLTDALDLRLGDL